MSNKPTLTSKYFKSSEGRIYLHVSFQSSQSSWNYTCVQIKDVPEVPSKIRKQDLEASLKQSEGLYQKTLQDILNLKQSPVKLTEVQRRLCEYYEELSKGRAEMNKLFEKEIRKLS